MRRLTAVLSATLLTASLSLAMTAAPASAGGVVIESSVACQPDGSATIAWNLHNHGGLEDEIVSASIEGVATQVVFEPNPVPAGGSATATTSVAGTVKGSITITVTLRAVGAPDFTDTGTQELAGDCPQPIATTVTTTAAAPGTAAHAAAATQPRFTG